MKYFFYIALLATIILFVSSCKEKYELPATANNNPQLVVEGYLNSGSDLTTIRLSRTINLKDTGTSDPETGATVTVEAENGGSTPLFSNNNGEYVNYLNLNNNVRYRLRINTFGGGEYLSDFVPVVSTPPIDSISWKKKEDGLEKGVQLYVSTHDPLNKTRYYRWEYNETWEFHSYFFSGYTYVNGSFIVRPDPTKVSVCWNSDVSTRIITGSSAKQGQDIISLMPISLIPIGSPKVLVRYSMEVKQYALTQEGYNYWDILRKNTEKLGTLFDPQPSRLFSNIHGITNPNEEVIGFLSAGSFAKKRIFINNAEVLPWPYFSDCAPATKVFPDRYESFFGSGRLIPTTEILSPFGFIIGYNGGEPRCVDCTLTGTNVRPFFW
jgi:Domain of unknown function (DUF4249)